jgi:tRNA nucleotidyltransferase (CCA-adding enzyme)
MLELGLEVINIISNNGFEAFIVGGFPRDLYLGIDSDDIDITTNASLEELSLIFPDIKENGFMSYIIDYKGKVIQITTYRKDISYIGNRKPDNQERVNTLDEDLLRRDFIINTLCINKDGKYVDLLGAKKDIDSKIIRTVKNPNTSFKEDALRMLRCIRFSTVLDFDIDDDTSKAINSNKEIIRMLSFFRKKQELDKIFSSYNYQKGIDLIKKYGLEEVLSIKIGNNIYADDYLSVWSQIEYDERYPFTREEKRIINSYTDN